MSFQKETSHITKDSRVEFKVKSKGTQRSLQELERAEEMKFDKIINSVSWLAANEKGGHRRKVIGWAAFHMSRLCLDNVPPTSSLSPLANFFIMLQIFENPFMMLIKTNIFFKIFLKYYFVIVIFQILRFNFSY